VKATGCERGHIQIFEIDQLIFIKTACQKTRLAGHSSAVLPFMYLTVKLRVALTFKYSLPGFVGDFFTHYCSAVYQNAVY
jgi:hypothetical protein